MTRARAIANVWQDWSENLNTVSGKQKLQNRKANEKRFKKGVDGVIQIDDDRVREMERVF